MKFSLLLLLLMPDLCFAEQPAEVAFRACSQAAKGSDKICDAVNDVTKKAEIYGNKILKKYANEQVAAGVVILTKTAVDKKVLIELSHDETVGRPTFKIGVDSVKLDLKWELP
jgi:hypothetical protein